MKKLILQEWITVDGFAAGPDDNLRFFEKPEIAREADDELLEFMDSIDTILLGANTYRMFLDYWPEATTEKEPIADKLNSTPKIVFSNSLGEAPWGRWEAAKIRRGNAADALRELKSGSGKDMVLWGSLSLAQSFMKEGLIDEYHLRVCPSVLGEGKSLFNAATKIENLNLLESRPYPSGTVLLRYAND